MLVFRLCSYTKIAQSVVSMSCQVAFLIEVNRNFVDAASFSALAFLYLNISVTISVSFINPDCTAVKTKL